MWAVREAILVSLGAVFAGVTACAPVAATESERRQKADEIPRFEASEAALLEALEGATKALRAAKAIWDGGTGLPIDTAIESAAELRVALLRKLVGDFDPVLEDRLKSRINARRGQVPPDAEPCVDFHEAQGPKRRPLLRLLALQNPRTFPVSQGDFGSQIEVLTTLALGTAETALNIKMQLIWHAPVAPDEDELQPAWLELKLQGLGAPIYIETTYLDPSGSGRERASCLVIWRETPYRLEVEEARRAWLLRQITPRDG